MLACAYGMSTNMLVQKMKAASKAQGRDDEIWAGSKDQVGQKLGEFDVLLLGPQVAYALDDVKKVVGDQAPVALINQKDYGLMNGEKVLETADALVEEFQK